MPATQVLQTYLDAMSDHVLVGDFDSYQSGVELPFHLVTTDSSVVVTTHEDLRAGFDHYRVMLASQVVTAYIRIVNLAVLLDDRLISGHYTTHIISGGTRIVAPFPSQIVLRDHGAQGWRAASITNGAQNMRWPMDRIDVRPPSNVDPDPSTPIHRPGQEADHAKD